MLDLLYEIKIYASIGTKWKSCKAKQWSNEIYIPYPANGAAYIDYYFKGHFFTTLLYLVWYAALWQHLTHGVWSAMQTLGMNNEHWLRRWQRISMVAASVICGAFALITLIFFVRGAGW